MADRNDDRALRHTAKFAADAIDQLAEWARRNKGIADYNYKADSMELAQYHRGKADAYQEAVAFLTGTFGV